MFLLFYLLNYTIYMKSEFTYVFGTTFYPHIHFSDRTYSINLYAMNTKSSVYIPTSSTAFIT